MTELEAIRTLQSPLSGPSLRYDAEVTLRHLGWTDLGIRLAMKEDLGPAVGLESQAE